MWCLETVFHNIGISCLRDYKRVFSNRAMLTWPAKGSWHRGHLPVSLASAHFWQTPRQWHGKNPTSSAIRSFMHRLHSTRPTSVQRPLPIHTSWMPVSSAAFSVANRVKYWLHHVLALLGSLCNWSTSSGGVPGCDWMTCSMAGTENVSYCINVSQ